MSDLCPGTDGTCVYQARALYNAVYSDALVYPVCSGSGARTLPGLNTKGQSSPWSVDLYPNPASNFITILSNNPQEVLYVQIRDLSGRMVFNKTVKASGLISNLDLELLNGAYIISISNVFNNKVVKKLIIAR